MTQLRVPSAAESKTSGTLSQKKTLAFCGSKTKYHPMIKTFSSITLLFLASGWLSILPAQTQTKYVCTHCNKEFSSKSEESQKCPQNKEQTNPGWKQGPHEFRAK
jgi:hypothetical protein